MKRLTLALAIAASSALLSPSVAQADFGIDSFGTSATKRDGTLELRAGAHPYEYEVSFAMNQDSEGADGQLGELIVDLPPGFVGNPLAIPRCSGADFEGQTPQCPGNTQIGVAHIQTPGQLVHEAVYNLVPSPGAAASFGLSVLGNNSFQQASLRTGEDYGARVSDLTVPTANEILSVTETIWGVPADSGHDPKRVCSFLENGVPTQIEGCESEIPELPFLSLPTSCTGPLATTLRVASTEEPGVFQEESVQSLGPSGQPQGLNSCERPPFKPTIEAQPQTNAADSPTGLHFGLRIPQNEDPSDDATATAHLKDTVVTLPKGLVVNPSSADGLGACSPAQVDLEGPGPANCPDNSKIGTAEVHTPLLDNPVKGAVYLAKQGDNPFGSLLAIYIALHDPERGIVVKLAGEVKPDPVTGQLETTFLDNPQLPFEDFELDFFGGPRAALTTPPTCGKYTTTSRLTPWTSPEGQDRFPSDSFNISAGPNGGGCASTEAQMPNTPGLDAGTTMPLAGAYSPFVLRLDRENGSQRLAAIETTLPPGLTGKLAGLAQCSEAQLAVAASRSNPGQGALEQQSPSCPASSEVGTIVAGAGSGNPFHVGGKAYLAGPYKGAPLSLAFITPAVAGPFDLGAVLVRAAAYVDPVTAQINVKSDPLPQILQGIPLDVRSIAVDVSRDQFTLNPTNCSELQIQAQAISTLGGAASLAERFQVGGCRGLGFKPRFNLRLKGGTKRGENPKLIATLTPRAGDANIAALSVKLPRSAFLDQAHIRTVCTRVQFAGDQCPKGSIYGRVKVNTPLLDYPLPGTVYLRSSSNELPDLVADFRGPAHQPIRIELSGRTDSVKGALRNTFDLVPDAPFSSARLELFGGKRGLVVNSRDLCANRFRATARFRAQSGARYEARPVVGSDCGDRAGGKGKRRR
jgi:hypothetical protein